jgi:hypothetical protein
MEVAGLCFAVAPLCAKIVKSIHDFRNKYKRASMTMVAIATECSLISVVLDELEHLDLEQNLHSTHDRQQRIFSTIETVVLGCQLTLEAVSDNVAEIMESSDGHIDTGGKVIFLFKEDEMKEHLVQLRAYQTSITTLLATLQKYDPQYRLSLLLTMCIVSPAMRCMLSF